MKKILALFLAILSVLYCTAGIAEKNEIDGTVVSMQTRTVRTEAYGRVADVLVREGQSVKAGDVLVTLETTKVYARESGTVHLFGSAGDTGEMLESRYGAVAYLEPDAAMRITDASTKYAADTEENKTMHPGEMLNLVAVADAKRTGTGYVTAVSGNTYTVEDVRGDLELNEKVVIYRGETIAVNRVGKGTVVRSDPEAYTGTGIVSAFRVENDAHVNKGDLLFETLEGSYSGTAGADLSVIRAAEDGVVASVDVAPGQLVSAEADAVASLYPLNALRVQGMLNETRVSGVQSGDAVTLIPVYGPGESFTGTVERISLLPAETETAEAAADTAEEEMSDESDEIRYDLYIVPDDPAALPYGMTVMISFGEE